jgi:hypothetical protein
VWEADDVVCREAERKAEAAGNALVLQQRAFEALQSQMTRLTEVLNSCFH